MTSYCNVILSIAIFGQEVDLWHSSLEKLPVRTRSSDWREELVEVPMESLINPIPNLTLIYCSVQRQWTLKMQSQTADSLDNKSGEPRGNLSQQRYPPKTDNLQLHAARLDHQIEGNFWSLIRYSFCDYITLEALLLILSWTYALLDCSLHTYVLPYPIRAT